MPSHSQPETPVGDTQPALLNPRPGIFWDAAVIAVLVCTAIVVLALPLFPSQDGPVHLYYADIIRSLLTHSGVYAQHFEIKSFLTPYALEYYSLVVLETAFSPEMSEKLVVCCYIFAFGFGFKYLVESVAERRSPWTLAGMPFCMNALVYLGSLNYSIGVALTLFLCGFWIRCSGRLRSGRVTAVLACFLLTLFTHPVPVAIFLLFVGLHFAADLACAAKAGPGLWARSLQARWRPLTMIALMAGTAAVWVGMFVNHSGHFRNQPSSVGEHGWIRAVSSLLKLWPVAPFTSPAYRGGLLFLLAMTGLFLFVGAWIHKDRISPAAIAIIATGAICFTLFCIAPGSINGSGFFPERFAIFWVLFLIAATAGFRPPRLCSLAAGVTALCVTIAVLALQWVNVSRIAPEVSSVMDTLPAKAGSVGLIIGEKSSLPEGLSFDPFFWGGVHYFRRSRAILANAPWLDVPLVMIRPAHPDRWSYLNPLPAGESLLGVLSAGEAVPDLSFVVREGRPGAMTDAVISGLGWSPLTPNGGSLGIYRPHP